MNESDFLLHAFYFKVSITGFSKTVNAYRIIFPDSERRLIELSQDLFAK